MNLLVDSVFTRLYGSGISKPRISEKDYKKLCIPVCPDTPHCRHAEVACLETFFPLILPQANPQFGSRVKSIDSSGNLFLSQPFSSRFQQSVLEVLGSFQDHWDSVLYVGYNISDWHDLWRKLKPSITAYDNIRTSESDIFWCDDASMSPDRIFHSIRFVKLNGLWVQNFDWNNFKLWMPLITDLLPYFDSLELVLSIQSGFPIPKSYIVGRKNARFDLQTNQCVVKQCVKLSYLSFLRETFQIIYRNENRSEWLQRRKEQKHDKDKEFQRFQEEHHKYWQNVMQPKSPVYALTSPSYQPYAPTSPSYRIRIWVACWRNSPDT